MTEQQLDGLIEKMQTGIQFSELILEICHTMEPNTHIILIGLVYALCVEEVTHRTGSRSPTEQRQSLHTIIDKTLDTVERQFEAIK